MKTNTYKTILLSICLSVIPGLGFSPVSASTFTGSLSNTSNQDRMIIVAAPTASPAAGTYTSAQNVILTTNSASSSVRYALDNSAPTCEHGTVYSSPISVGANTTVKAISCYPGNISSNTSSFDYAINITTENNSATSGGSTTGGGGGGGGGRGSSSGGYTYTLSAQAKRIDTNNDGKINILEFVALMSGWGKTGSGIAGDFNADGRVDILDFVLLMANWTK
jgi:uncharacterized membrane protein YgcG